MIHCMSFHIRIDLNKVLEIDNTISDAQVSQTRIKKILDERTEMQKAEMFDK